MGYWKNHLEAWPAEMIEIGGHIYTQAEAIDLLRTPIRNNKWLNLYKQLVAAKLNLLS